MMPAPCFSQIVFRKNYVSFGILACNMSLTDSTHAHSLRFSMFSSLSLSLSLQQHTQKNLVEMGFLLLPSVVFSFQKKERGEIWENNLKVEFFFSKKIIVRRRKKGLHCLFTFRKKKNVVVLYNAHI